MKGIGSRLQAFLQVENIFLVDAGLEWAVGVVAFLAHLVSLGCVSLPRCPGFGALEIKHLFLVDLTEKGITGKEAEEALGRAGITVNKNTIPRETRSPFVTSGIRLGTPCVTTRGMKEKEMAQIASWIADCLKDVNDVKRQAGIQAEVKKLCAQFPFYS